MNTFGKNCSVKNKICFLGCISCFFFKFLSTYYDFLHPLLCDLVNLIAENANSVL